MTSAERIILTKDMSYLFLDLLTSAGCPGAGRGLVMVFTVLCDSLVCVPNNTHQQQALIKDYRRLSSRKQYISLFLVSIQLQYLLNWYVFRRWHWQVFRRRQ